MNRHPLHDAEFALRYSSQRRTGASTAQALEYIAQAIRTPGVRVGLHDHAEFETKGRANWHLADMVQRIVCALGLKHLHIARARGGFGEVWCLVFENREAQEAERVAAQNVRLQAVADAASIDAAARAVTALRPAEPRDKHGPHWDNPDGDFWK